MKAVGLFIYSLINIFLMFLFFLFELFFVSRLKILVSPILQFFLVFFMIIFTIIVNYIVSKIFLYKIIARFFDMR